MNERTEEISVLDYLQILLTRRWMIFKVVFLAGVASIGISLLIPNTYTARATILPPEQGSSSGLEALMGNSNIPVDMLGIPGISELSSSGDLFVEIILSRSLNELLVDQYNLVEVYEVDNRFRAIEQLQASVSVSVENSGIISLSVDDRDPNLAADLANTFINELDRFNKEKNMTGAKNTRLFVEKRLLDTRKDLEKALAALQAFQEQYQLISLPEQAKMLVEAAAEVESQLQIRELEIAVLRKILNTQHPSIVQIQMEIDELKKQLNHLTLGDKIGTPARSSAGTDDGRVNIPFNQIPALQLQLGQLMVNVKVQQSVVEMLLKQYEQAKIQEVRDTPTVRILDAAVPPDLKSGPKRSLIVIMSTVLSLLLGVSLAFVLEYRQGHGEESEKIGQISSVFHEDYIRFKQFFKRG
ncbi:MAG: GNVR domain-containing protein [Gemmatimonadota bacterium]|nr:GNVR domain-containing protein [Gemmatimonadota bacterium]